MAINLFRRKLNAWFVANSGNEHSSNKCGNTTIQFQIIIFLVAYLDEKMIYTTNRRWKMKKLLRGHLKELGVHVVIQQNSNSRRYHKNLMFLRVVARPHADMKFDFEANSINIVALVEGEGIVDSDINYDLMQEIKKYSHSFHVVLTLLRSA